MSLQVTNAGVVRSGYEGVVSSLFVLCCLATGVGGHKPVAHKKTCRLIGISLSEPQAKCTLILDPCTYCEVHQMEYFVCDQWKWEFRGWN